MFINSLNANDTKALKNKLKNVFGSVITNNLTDFSYVYESYRNKTFKAKYRDEWVQIRIPKHTHIEYENEQKVIENFNDYLFYEEGFLIKKWFDGQNLERVHINKKIISNIVKEVKRLQGLHIRVSVFDWYNHKFEDDTYEAILKKYPQEDLVLSHNNLTRSNILVNNHGSIRLIDYQYAALNSKYADPASLHIAFGVDIDYLCREFELNKEKLIDFIYLVKQRRKTIFKQFYKNFNTPISKITQALRPYQYRAYNYDSRFISERITETWAKQLDMEKIKNYYFVPPYVYCDSKIIIWKWMSNNTLLYTNDRKIKSIAKAIKILHSTTLDFPKSNIYKKMTNLLINLGIEKIKDDFDSVFVNNVKKWIASFNNDTNCHNNLSMENIFFTKNQSVQFIQWDFACKSDPLFDIAILFENMMFTETQEKYFWKCYGKEQPENFIKYRICAQFIAYLINRNKLDDDFLSSLNVKRIEELLERFNGFH
ncbi:hypothetical protein [Mycoplasma phocoenae]|uniref:Aminoglycoside phosphotransferase domain-containing protein n=1 Tax=Mycoplasma phocoenae TaxID=754517 RepID=A0A858U567_9MOLU|nr:hypothetical protein [Mycoplasma phocoenae]QJG67209.1 hypothetical protein HGG69_02755 [Mycoplasma phocoenae]